MTKTYVGVRTFTAPDGASRPFAILLDNRLFSISSIVSVQSTRSVEDYTVRIRDTHGKRSTTHLFLEKAAHAAQCRWYVMLKEGWNSAGKRAS